MRRPFVIGFVDGSDQRRSWMRFYRSPGEANHDSREVLAREFGPDGYKLLEVRRIDCATPDCSQPPLLGTNPDTGKQERFCARCNARANEAVRLVRHVRRLHRPAHLPRERARHQAEELVDRFDEDGGTDR